MPKKYGMVIDLHKCVGCGACAMGCKEENNTQARADGQGHNWADFTMKSEGVFPQTRYTQMPVLCNHCTNAPCVENCPVTPTAMFKAADNTTLHNQERCIGCRACQMTCPYSNEELGAASNRGETYSVISFNPFKKQTQPQWHDKSVLIAGCTSSGAAVAKAAGALPPDANMYKSGDYQPVRKPGVVEKCILCHHRTTAGLQPACVDACPATARTFGDLSDPNSEISRALKKHKASRLRVEAGTDPNVYYIRSYDDPTV